MWTGENINRAASTYVSNLICDRFSVGMEMSEELQYLIKEAFITGAHYIIDNTQNNK